MHNFKELKVWKLSMELSKSIFETTRTFPSEHKFGLASQLFRCAVSIPSNIAEGCGRKSDKELKQFVSTSLGSSFELETQIIIAKEVELITLKQFETLNDKIIEIQKMLSGFSKSISI
ncbi:four helix bundle protein [Pedobacter arcticus]|uniref:four helix bundle protein n=1 Tax=Pedobacter arcticus TaxID=752140 RepID=UPI000304C000|nr:four helix bundle protein [Pedobacter arcticus]